MRFGRFRFRNYYVIASTAHPETDIINDKQKLNRYTPVQGAIQSGGCDCTGNARDSHKNIIQVPV